MVKLSLPWPPSFNKYWRHFRGRVYVSARGKAYRSSVATIWEEAGQPRFGTARLGVKLDVFPPDRREHDLDNLLKALLDALEHAGLYERDSQIDALEVYRGWRTDEGQVNVTARKVNPGWAR
jgi:crossover junction endodeoxyribonuclease RusA